MAQQRGRRMPEWERRQFIADLEADLEALAAHIGRMLDHMAAWPARGEIAS